MGFEAFERQSREKQEAIVAAGIEEFSGKAYPDAGTDAITAACGISKGLLFHYFGSKKNFYLYCLDRALDRLTVSAQPAEGSFYTVLFSAMEEKFSLCARFPAETGFVNMASRETCAEVAEGTAEVLGRYAPRIYASSAAVMEKAVSALPVKGKPAERVREGLNLYVKAVINQYLLAYRSRPDEFFRNKEVIKREVKEYLDLMLYGVVESGEKT